MDTSDNPIMYVFNMLGAAINGALQVFTDFINLIIDMVPNPDPFPELIESIPDEVVMDSGFFMYWVDQFIGLHEANALIVTFFALFAASLVFALIFKAGSFIKP